MNRRDNAVIMLGSVLAVVLVYFALPAIHSSLRIGEPKIIRASVRLVNNCPLADHSFTLRNTQTGRSTPFYNGIAHTEAERGTYLQIVLASRFNDVIFNGEKQRIRVRMTMTADCSSGDRMRGVMDGIGDKFGK
jgi:hypothetical protein